MDTSKFHDLYPFAPHYLETRGLQYHYLDEGAGDPVLMLHGNPTWSFYFRSLVRELSPDCRAIVPDHIGCGRSEKPGTDRYDYRFRSRVEDVETLLDRLDLKQRLTLVLHDWGGMIGMAVAHRRPERIGRIVILNTAAFFPPGNKGLPLRLRIVRNFAPVAVPAVLGLNLFARGALYMAPRKRLEPRVRAGLIAPYDSWTNRIATLRFVQDIPVRPGDPGFGLVREVDDNLHQFTGVPMLILWGRHDFVFDNDYFMEWWRRFPEAEAHLFPDAGHYLLEDVPEKIAPLVRRFIGRHPL